MSNLSAAQKKLERALQRLESAVAVGTVEGEISPPTEDATEVMRLECESLRAQNGELEVEVVRLKEENSALGECNVAAAGRVGDVLNRLKDVLAEQPA